MGEAVKCPHCEKSFKNELLRGSHVAAVHRTVKCHLCFETVRKTSLKYHMETAHPDATLQCDHCQKQFHNKWTLRHHVYYKHPTGARHQCDRCVQTFKHASSLEAHRLKHHKRQFECAHCEKAFEKRHNLTLHMQSHTGERPYQCSFCEKTFARKYNRTKHMRLHEGERALECDECGKHFVRKVDHSRHIKEFHAELDNAQ